MPTGYIETTIPTFYFETRKKLPAPAWRIATRTWWDENRHRYEQGTSEIVFQGLDRAPPQKRDEGRKQPPE